MKCHSATAETVNSNSSATQLSYKSMAAFIGPVWNLFISSLHCTNIMQLPGIHGQEDGEGLKKQQPQGLNWPLDHLCSALCVLK